MTEQPDLLIDLEAPPDAGNSYLGMFTIRNPWVCWLIGQGAGELCAETMEELLAPERPPDCPECSAAAVYFWQRVKMVRIPGAWKCYRHDLPVVIMDVPKLPRAPEGDVLSKLIQDKN